MAPSQAQRYGQNSAVLAIWARNSNAGQTASVFGIGGSNAVGLNPRGPSGAIASWLNSATATVGGVVATGYGLSAVDRSSSNAVPHYKDGVVNGTAGSAANAALSSASFALDRGGSTYAANQFCAAIVPAHLTGAQHGALHAALNAYLSAIGVAELPIATATSTSAAAKTLPDGGTGAASGKGWTCTGLARLPDRSWLVGNDGRWASAADPQAGSIIHLSADRTAILHQWTVAALGLAASSGQQRPGCRLAADGDRRRARPPVVRAGRQRHLSAADRRRLDGGSARVLPGSAGANGVAFDAGRGQVIVLGTSEVTWRYPTSGQILSSVAVHAAEADHLFHDPADDQLHDSFGANGVPGGVVRLDPTASSTYGGPACRAIMMLAGADAIKGTVAPDCQ